MAFVTDEGIFNNQLKKSKFIYSIILIVSECSLVFPFLETLYNFTAGLHRLNRFASRIYDGIVGNQGMKNYYGPNNGLWSYRGSPLLLFWASGLNFY